MKKPSMKPMRPSGDGKPTKERDQGKGRGTGINKGMVKESIPQVVKKNRYGKPTQTQKM